MDNPSYNNRDDDDDDDDDDSSGRKAIRYQDAAWDIGINTIPIHDMMMMMLMLMLMIVVVDGLHLYCVYFVNLPSCC